MPTALLTREELANRFDELVEFDVPFTITPTTEGPRTNRVDSNPLRVPDCVTLLGGPSGLLIDSIDTVLTSWQPVTGFSGQHGYSGPVMHPSEMLSGPMARHLLERDEPAAYVVMAVFPEGPDSVDFDGPAGWILLRRR